MLKEDLLEKIRTEAEEGIRNVRKREHLARFIVNNIDIPDDFPAQLRHSWYYPGVRSIHWNPKEGSFSYKGFPKAVKVELRLKKLWGWDKEDREILGTVMSLFKCIFHAGSPEWRKRGWETTRLPDTHYYGLGEINGYRVIIDLECPWPPQGCELKVVDAKATELVCARA